MRLAAAMIWTAAVVAGSLGVGCTRNEQALRASATALEQKDYDQALLLANEAMDEKLTPAEAAEALYLRGRAYEQRPVTSQAQLDANMQAARNSYVEALKRGPSRQLSTYIYASLGKVAFYQDDFSTAAQQLRLAYGELKEPELKAATLYYMARAEQRSGRFAEADRMFGTLVQQYAESTWSAKAKEAQGVRAFYVQLGVYKNPASMDALVKALQQRKIRPATAMDAQGRYLLRAGPYGSYAQAKQTRQQILDLFKDAFVVP